ncbi:MAG: transposase [Thaumarchaeota archaeon]|nr:transposase [Nitrososphaerota archaeon]
MERAILLQTEATESKNDALKSFLNEAHFDYNRILREREGCKTFMSFHWKVWNSLKTTGFNSQVRCDLERSAWRKKAIAVDSITPKFNVPRNCKTFETKRFFFVELGMYPKRRVAVPIKRNRDFQRFQSLLKTGWTCKTFGLTPSLEICAYLSKEEKELRPRKNMLGIDVNAKHLAVSVVSPAGEIRYQTYLGKQIWVKRKKLMERRALLQSVGAGRKLDRLMKREFNFVNTNLGQTVREVMKLADKYDADIAIEKLRRFSPKGRRFNRTVMRIPFHKLRQILEARCFDNDITLNTVDSWRTSKWCIRCGAVGQGHSANYSLFRCEKCGLVMNSDRKASVAIAVKSLLERSGFTNHKETFQISGRRVPVMGLVKASYESSRNEQPVAPPGQWTKAHTL